MRNILLCADSYKHSHFLQYPPNTQYISSYIEARGTPEDGKVMFFGIQAFIRQYLTTPFTAADIDEAGELITAHGLPFNREGWEYILKEHLGLLPVHIDALPEGTLVDRGVPLVQIHNTDPKVPWLTSFVETALLRAIWYPSTVATTSFAAKVVIYDALMKSSEDPEAGLPFKLHDFGARGVSSGESAAIGGLAHLLNFQGTDTLEALRLARSTYVDDNLIAGFSIPASEHSTMTSWGRENEAEAYRNMLAKFGDGLVSIVSDSYDLDNAVNRIFGEVLRDQITNIRGKLIVRPDSGDPVLTPIAVIDALAKHFGYTTNAKGYKVLNGKVGVIQGDGMNFQTLARLTGELVGRKWSIDNIAFGMGGKLLQSHNRDDFSFAMKCNAISYGAGWEDVQKKPATDPAKASKAGRQIILLDGHRLYAKREDDADPSELEANLLTPVYHNGIAAKADFLFARQRAHEAMKTTWKKLTAEYEELQAAE